MVQIIAKGTESDSESLKLVTRKRNWIKNVVRREHLPERLKAAEEIFKHSHPQARLRSSTAIYNCLGLVFASRRTWVGIDDLEEEIRNVVLPDDGYYQLNDVSELEVGDLVVYRNENNELSHVGVVICIKKDLEKASFQVTVLSKWGHDGEYIHPAEHVPTLLGKPSEYWSERRKN